MHYSVQACCKIKCHFKYVQRFIPDEALIWMKFKFIQRASGGYNLTGKDLPLKC